VATLTEALEPSALEAPRTMSSSSTACPSAGQPTPRSSGSPAAVRDNRRPRRHLFPLEDYRAATITGGTVRSYCGLLETVPRRYPSHVEEAVESSADDCATCVDLWHGRRRVRL
jgi:hypothetical protein